MGGLEVTSIIVISLKSMGKVYVSNFRNGTIKAMLKDFDDLAEESDISYKDTTKVG